MYSANEGLLMIINAVLNQKERKLRKFKRVSIDTKPIERYKITRQIKKTKLS